VRNCSGINMTNEALNGLHGSLRPVQSNATQMDYITSLAGWQL